MSSKNAKVVALLVSDIHLSLEPPIARSVEPDWLEAQGRQLDELRALAGGYKVPVICAGDLFHHWKSPPELINFALDRLPDGMFAIPGQHDLPHHSLSDMHKSGFGVLNSTGKIKYLDHVAQIGNIVIHPYPWGKIPKEGAAKTFQDPKLISIAVIHAYCWMTGYGFPGAPDKSKVKKFHLKGFDVALFGDNHIPFLTRTQGCVVLNHGCFIRRRSDERDIGPQIGLLYSDGSVGLHRVNIEHDRWLPIQKAKHMEEVDISMEGLMREFEQLGNSGEDFRSALDFYFKRNDVPLPVRAIINRTMEHGS